MFLLRMNESGMDCVASMRYELSILKNTGALKMWKGRMENQKVSVDGDWSVEHYCDTEKAQ